MSEFTNFEPISRDTYTFIMDCIAKNQIYIWNENALLDKLCWLKLVVNILSTISHTTAVIERLAHGDDLVRLSADISSALMLWQSIFLYIQLCVNKKLIRNLIKNLDSKWRTDDQLRPEMIALKHDSVKTFYKWILLFKKGLSFFCISYLSWRLIYVAVCHVILKREVVFIMRYHIKVPFRYDDNFALYCVVYIVHCAILLDLAYLVTYDLLLMNATMRDLRLLFIMLQDDLRHIVRPGEHVDVEATEMRLKALIPKHRDLLQLMAELSEAFGAIFLIHLAFFSGTMCFYGFAARISRNLEGMINLPVVGIILMSLYTCCSSGQHLTDASMDMAKVAYDAQWQLMSREYRKCILFIILRSQKTQYIKSTSFTDVSLKTFTKCPERLRDAFDFPGIPSSDPDMVIMESPQEYTEKDTTNGLNILNVTWSFLSLITKMYEA